MSNAKTKSADIALLPPADRANLAMGASKTEADLLELVAKSQRIVAVIDKDGREEAHRAAMELRDARVTIASIGKAAREDATAFSKAVIQAETRLIAIMSPEETRVLALRNAFDDKVAAEKAEKARIEKARVDAIQTKINAIRSVPGASAHDDSAHLQATLDDLNGFVATSAEFAEFSDAANEAAATARGAVASLLAAALVREEEAARVLAQAEENRLAAIELERQRAELAAQEAERQRIAEAELVERQRVAAETKRQLEAQQAQIAQAAQLVEEQRRIAEKAQADERATFEAEKAAFAKQKEDAAEAARVAALPVAPINPDVQPDPVVIGVDFAGGPDETATAIVEETDKGTRYIAIIHDDAAEHELQVNLDAMDLVVSNLLAYKKTPDQIHQLVDDAIANNSAKAAA